jgi:hypothetical protein
MLSRGVKSPRRARSPKQKTGTENSVAGFTIRSLIPLVTKLGCQFIASTTYYS